MKRVAATRVADFTIQPVYAYFDIYVGDRLLSTMLPRQSTRPNIYQSFEMTRIKGTGNTCNFVLFDDDWYRIEKILSDNFNDIYVRYGYSNGGATSPKYKMILKNYSISFTSTGVILSVSAISESAISNLAPMALATDTYAPGKKYYPTDAVKKICEAAGIKVSDKNFDEADPVDRGDPYVLRADNPITYINEIILPEANAKGDRFIFYVDENGEAHFQKHIYGKNGPPKRTYVFQKGYDSVVKDLVVDVKGVFGGTTLYETATGLKSTIISPKDKSVSYSSYLTTDTITQATGILQHTNANQSIPYVDPAGATPNQLSNKLYYYVQSANASAYEATIEILGDPNIDFLDDVRLIVVADDGSLHHTSGVYLIQGVTDTISGGEMTTTLKLMRNGDFDAGIELINPKELIR